MFSTKIQGDQILGFFHVFIIPRNSSKNYAMKLDNALTQIGKLCLGKNLRDDDMCFS